MLCVISQRTFARVQGGMSNEILTKHGLCQKQHCSRN